MNRALKALEKNSISQVKQMYGWTSFTYYIPTFRVTMNSNLSEELVPAYYSTDSKNQAHRVLQSKLGKELNFLACFFVSNKKAMPDFGQTQCFIL